MSRYAFALLFGALLLGATVTRADTDLDDGLGDDDDDLDNDWDLGAHSCSSTGAPGGWSAMSLTDLKNLEKITPLLKAQVFSAIKEANLLTCADDDYDADLAYACSQVVAGMNYKIVFSLDCDADNEANDDNPLFLQADIYVPLSGEPVVNVTRINVGCSLVSDDDLSCHLAGYKVDCDATAYTADGPGVVCTVYKESNHEEQYTLSCPIATANGKVTVACKDSTLAQLPGWLAGNVTQILSKWNGLAAPTEGDVWTGDDLDDGLNDRDTDGPNDKDDK